ncbi:hypothetical protein L1049_000646 [Liquidambar formosana]|uniref:Apple domain-containing protein n=1 Tax=Liquidambar formosana TaxID=63359 RepID=A0AAP0NBD0_LIQFO
MENVKLPDFSDLELVKDRKECEDKCMKNCSCNAYAFDGEIGCMIWNGDLVDVQHFANGGRTLYLRLADSELVFCGIGQIRVSREKYPV